MTAPVATRPNQRGLILLTVMVFLLVATLASSSLVVIYTTQLQREKEEQLLFVGAQYRKAIGSYYGVVPPGGARSLPQTLDALVADNRFPQPVHHLRRLYPDPMTGQPDWQLVRNGTGIVGIRSRSESVPIKRRGFAALDSGLQDKESYGDWIFGIVGQP